ncbi:MAG: polysaccharide biosynthesis/export family protein [Rhizomicrobium sp.]|jgi:polysaccharide export outer membrane protein
MAPTTYLRIAIWIAGLALGIFVTLHGVHAAEAGQPASLRADVSEPQTTYHLATGDKVHVIVYGEDDLSGDFDVDSNGYLRLPLIGQVKAQGLASHELEDRIAAALADGYLQQPRVNVEIIGYRPFYIIGEVQKPGQYPYVNAMNALNAVALAGGYTEKAEASFVYVRRNGETEEHKVPCDQATLIQPGDVVRVPTSLFWALVNVAGPVSAIVSTRWYLPL